MKANLINKVTGEVVAVTATTDHPACSYGKAVWVDSDGNALQQVDLPDYIYAPYEVEIVDGGGKTLHPAVQAIIDKMRSEGITMYKLAQMSGLTGSTISTMLSGKSSPSLATLDKVCEALELKINVDKKI